MYYICFTKPESENKQKVIIPRLEVLFGNMSNQQFNFPNVINIIFSYASVGGGFLGDWWPLGTLHEEISLAPLQA